MTNPIAADCRRATALVCHYGRQNLEGVNAVLAETVEAKRITPLFVAVLDLHEQIIPVLYTPDGLACANAMMYTMAASEENAGFFLSRGDVDTARAARLITAHGQRDENRFNELMRQASDADRLTELLVGVIVVSRAVVPGLYCELGSKVLERCVLDWAAREDATE